MTDAQELSNYVNSSSDLTQHFQYGSRPSAEDAAQGDYHTPTTMVPLQQLNDGQHWARTGQFHGDGSYTPSFARNRQLGEETRISSLLGSIWDRFLDASDAITRHDTAGLFEILNPAYEAISNVSETETTQLLALIVDLFQLLYRRPNHQDILRQLLHYVFALIPDAGRQNLFLSSNSQVLNLLGRRGYASPPGAPLDAAGGTDPRPTAPPNDYD